jgi:hypothetical protein
VPAESGRPPAGPAVRRFVGLAATLSGIVLFLAAPIASVVGALALLLASESWLIVRAGGFIVLAVLALVYLKSLLPRRIPPPAGVLPVSPDDQAVAYRFLSRVAEDAHAIAPCRLSLGSGVEHGLGGYRSVLDLFRTGRWEVRFGLWLWHFLTLSEFQAVVARTLAPLSGNRAARLRFAARSLLAALAEGDDRLDELAGTGHPLAPAADALRTAHRALAWPMRAAGSLLLRLEAGREEALADDLLAVRVAGSDALVHAILRADFAGAALRELDEALSLAARDGLFTWDYYAHSGDAGTILREAHNDFTLGEPPSLRGPTAGKYADVFEPGRRYLSGVWRGMPLGDAREQVAKKVFVAAEQDDRPATDLLEDPGRLRERLTHLRYSEVLVARPGFVPLPPETVRRWLAAHQGPPLPSRYAAIYDGGRPIDPGTPAERNAAVAAEPWNDARLLSAAAGLYGQAGERATTWRKTRTALDRLMAKTLYEPAGRVRAMADDLQDDLRKAGRWLAALDRWAYVIHVHMAAQLPDLALHDELLRRYESLLRFQPLATDAREYRNRVAAFARKLAGYPGPAPHRLARIAAREFTASCDDLIALLAEAREIRDPLLQAWTGDVPLSGFLYSHEDLPAQGNLPTEDFGRILLAAWDEVASKGRWLHRFSVAELLTVHGRIEAEFSALAQARGTAAEAVDVDPLPEIVDLDPMDPPRDDDRFSRGA